MTESDIAKQLENFISSLKIQGTLDECYDALVKLKDEHSPQFVWETLTLFFKETDITIYEMQKAMNKNPIEYSKVLSGVNKLKGSSASIGGGRMASACRDLRQASEDENKERSIDSFDNMKCEYEVLHESLVLISQTEQRIMASKDGGHAPS